MSNFKQIHGDNVIPFRLRGQFRPRSLQKDCRELETKYASHQRTSKTELSPTIEQKDEYVRLLASKGNPTKELVDDVAPAIVRRVVKHVRKRNRTNKRLPKTLPRVLNQQLQILCDFDHPAGIVLKNWLNGKLHVLPDGFEEAYARTSNRKETCHE